MAASSEVRRHAVSRDVARLSTGRRFPGEPRLPGPAAIAMVGAEVERGDGGATPARRYLLSPAPRDARLSAHAVRRHRHGEDRPHRVPDVVFRDDPGRLRSTGHGPRTMAIVGHMAVNLVRTAPGRHSLEVRRKRAAWNGDYLAAIPRQTP